MMRCSLTTDTFATLQLLSVLLEFWHVKLLWIVYLCGWLNYLDLISCITKFYESRNINLLNVFGRGLVLVNVIF